MYGLLVDRENVGDGANTVTNSYGLNISDHARGASDTCVNNYGIYIEAQTGGGTLNYSLYIAGGHATLASDTAWLYFGAGNDAHLTYDGTYMRLVTDDVAASDFVLDCGTQKTLVLAEVVYKDANVGALMLGKPASGAPGTDNWKNSAGADLAAETIAFAPTESVSGVIEVPHDYKEGTNLTFHVHWQGIDAPAGGTDNVQFQLKYSIMRDGQLVSAETTIVIERAFTTQYQEVRSDFPAINGSTAGIGGAGVKIGDQFVFQLARIAASSDEYGGEALVATVGFHYQVDTIGSRQIATK